MNGEEDWRRSALVATHVAKCENRQIAVALEFGLREQLGKEYSKGDVQNWIKAILSEEDQRELHRRLADFDDEFAEPGGGIGEFDAAAWEYEQFLKKKAWTKIKKKVEEYKTFLLEQHKR